MNTFLIYSEIGGFWGVTSEEIASFLRENKNKDVQIRINSVGGSVTEGVAIYNLLKAHNGKVEIAIDSICASIATIIALAGDSIKMNLGSIFMIHNPWSMAFGESEDFRKEAEVLDKFKETLVSIYMTKFNGSEEEIVEMMNSESWLSDKEAMKFGFVDSIEQELKISASIKYDLNKYFNSIPKKENIMKEKKEEAPEVKAEAPEVKAEETKVEEPAEETTEETKVEETAEETTEETKAEETTEEEKVEETAEEEIEAKIQAGVDKEFKRRETISSLAFAGQESLVNDLINEKATIEEASVRIIVNQKELGLIAPKAEENNPESLLKKLNNGAPKSLNEGGGDGGLTLESLKKQYLSCKDPKEKSLLAQKMSKLKKELQKQ